MQTSVVEVIKAAGLYKETGRIEQQMLKTILPNGEITEHKMSEMDYKDIRTLADELDIMLSLENPIIQGIFARNAMAIVNAVRCVNVDSASGFKGAVGAGRQLDLLLFRPEQFYLNTAYRTTWQRIVAAAADLWLIEGSTGGSDLTMGDEQAIVLLAHANFAELPCTSAIQITYVAQAYNIQNLDFGIADYQNAYPVLELKEPLTVFPKETIKTQVRYYKAGTDELQPIGVYIKMSSNLRILSSS